MQTPPVLVAGGVLWELEDGIETRVRLSWLFKEFETEYLLVDMKWKDVWEVAKGPFLFELQSEVVMRNRLVLLAALMWCLSGVAAAARRWILCCILRGAGAG